MQILVHPLISDTRIRRMARILGATVRRSDEGRQFLHYPSPAPPRCRICKLRALLRVIDEEGNVQ